MSEFLNHFLFSLTITGPIFLMLATGVFTRRFNIISDAFIENASKLVFQLTLPALLFLGIIESPTFGKESISFVLFAIISNVVFFVFCMLSIPQLLKEAKEKQGVVIQGAFRANVAIIGLAYVNNAYQAKGVALAAIYVAVIALLYNILAIIALIPRNHANKKVLYRNMAYSLIKNPLIIAIVLGIFVNLLQISIPKVIVHTGHYFANMTLPLALLCAGGSLNMKALQYDMFSNALSTFYKLILCPICLTTAAYLYGFNNMHIGIIFFMSAAPCAAVSYVMAKNFGGDAVLAANIIVATTIGSIFTCSIGIMLLSSLQLM